MRFDPKLVHPDQPFLSPNGDLDLPDELSALAQQLAEDAAHLSACYPPSSPESVARSATAWPRFVTAAAWSCAAAVAAVLLAHAGWQFLPAVVTKREVAGTMVPSAVDQSAAPLPSSPLTDPSMPSFGAHATISLSELSGPELEALVDLIQHDSPSALTVAF